jgi:ribose 5-phosphate isomerase B
MKIYIAADHAGYELKEKITTLLTKEMGYEVEDMGAIKMDHTDDYPDFVMPLAEKIAEDPDERIGIVIGGSGQGEAMGPNRLKGVRAIVFYGGPLNVIRIGREYNKANILALGARFIKEHDIEPAIRLFVETPLGEDERHLRRIEKIETFASKKS